MRRSLLRQGTQVVTTTSVHAVYVRISSEPKARLNVVLMRPAQSDTPTVQDRQFEIAHRLEANALVTDRKHRMLSLAAFPMALNWEALVWQAIILMTSANGTFLQSRNVC